MFQHSFGQTIICCVLGLFAVGLIILVKKQKIEIAHLKRDDLTLCWRRGPGYERIKMLIKGECRNKKNAGWAYAFFDLDGFKAVNDQLGHEEGDKALVAFASLLREYIRPADGCDIRYGGDEFVVFMPNTSLEDAQHVIDRILSFDLKIQGLRITSSIGVVHSSEELTPEELECVNVLADEQMLKAKSRGKKISSYIDYEEYRKVV